MLESAVVRRRSSPLKVFAILLFAALSISACGGGSKASSQFGGPYYIGGDTGAVLQTKADQKASQFADMNTKEWDSSQVSELTKGNDLLVSSIRWNRDHSNAPEAGRFQRYNYVVQGGKILVAVWDPRGDHGICNSGSPPFSDMQVEPGVMVNFYPETVSDKPTDTKDCITSDGTSGVMDALSKHFMIAQGVGSRVSDYDPRTWATTTVDYAGEIVVTVGDTSCSYTISQGSGTYAPQAGVPSDQFKYLDHVAKLFDDAVGTYPTYEFNKETDLEKPTTSTRATALDCR